MKSSHSQNYSYAVDNNNEIIHVSMATKGTEYFCPYCQAAVTPHMGKIRRWHFTHKANIETCSYETYLHKIAKLKIRKAFLDATNFVISYDVPAVCQKKESCKIEYKYNCVLSCRVEHDIRKFYDTCEEEIPYKNFVADLLISSSNKPEREPILIEIYVSHRSSQEKISDGVRIIEVQIRNEADIDNIVSSLRIDGEQNSNNRYIKNNKPLNIFYNFKGQVLKDPAYFNEIIPNYFHYLWMYDSGYFKAGKCLCNEDPLNYIPSNAHYVISLGSFSWTWAFLEFAKRGVDVKNCLICKYSALSPIEERICTLYKKFGTPRHPNINTAKSCQYFIRISNAQQNDISILDRSIIGDSDLKNPYPIIVCR